jgi:hypothetical protein
MNARDWVGRLPARPDGELVLTPDAEAKLAEDHEPVPLEEDTHPSMAFGGLWGRSVRAHKVEFRLRPGKGKVEGEALDYAWLPRVQWVPSEGKIVLPFTLGVTVTIRGINLLELKEKLRQHLVTWVAEQGDDPVFVQEERARAREEGREPVIIYQIRVDEAEAAKARESAEGLVDA